MCVKPVLTDRHISGGILRGGAWEFNIVNNVVKLMSRFQNATFLGKYCQFGKYKLSNLLDIGSNIGMYVAILAIFLFLCKKLYHPVVFIFNLDKVWPKKLFPTMNI